MIKNLLTRVSYFFKNIKKRRLLKKRKEEEVDPFKYPLY